MLSIASIYIQSCQQLYLERSIVITRRTAFWCYRCYWNRCEDVGGPWLKILFLCGTSYFLHFYPFVAILDSCHNRSHITDHLSHSIYAQPINHFLPNFKQQPPSSHPIWRCHELLEQLEERHLEINNQYRLEKETMIRIQVIFFTDI